MLHLFACLVIFNYFMTNKLNKVLRHFISRIVTGEMRIKQALGRLIRPDLGSLGTNLNFCIIKLFETCSRNFLDI